MANPTTQNIRRILGDLFTFVRSQEANKAVQGVTLDQLIQEQIKRNGDSESSNARQFNPYSYDPSVESPASEQPLARANYLGGSDVTLPSKLDRVLALKNEIDSIVASVQALPALDITTNSSAEDEADTILEDNPPLGPEGVP